MNVGYWINFLAILAGALTVLTVLYIPVAKYLSLRDQYARDRARYYALQPALDEGTLRGFSKRRAQQVWDNREQILQRVDEVLGPGSSVKLWFYQRWGGSEAVHFLLSDLRELAFAKRYIGHGGDYQDNRREEIENAELLRLRKDLAQRYDLSPFQQQAVDEVLDITPPEADGSDHGHLARGNGGR